MKSIFLNFKDTGRNVVNIHQVCKQWDKEWYIFQWHEKYTIVSDKVKSVISKKQAGMLIVLLGLTPEKSDTFRYAKVWRKE